MNKEKILQILKNCVAVVVIISLLIIIFYQNRDRDLFKFGKDKKEGEVTSSQQTENGFIVGDVKKLGDRVAYINTTSYRIFDAYTEDSVSKIALAEPTLHTDGNYAVCYDIGSLNAVVLKNEKECYSLKLSNNILSAKVNKNGYLFIATDKEGYNCECLVYNNRGEAIFKWDVSKSEFLDGDINNSNNLMALSLASAGEKMLLGEIELIDITQAEVISRQSYDKEAFYKVDFNANNAFTAVGSKNLKYFNSNGSEKWSYSYGGKTISKVDTSNPDFMLLAFEKSGSGIKGNSTDVCVVNRLGKQTSEASFDYIVDAVSVGEGNAALAFGKSIFVLNQNLKTKKKVYSESAVKKIALFSDNEHIFVINSSGGIILE